MRLILNRLVSEEDGLEPVEYALLLGFSTLVMVAGAYAMANILFDSFVDTTDQIDVTIPDPQAD
jgi:Flp pilus assembly pilin Flp